MALLQVSFFSNKLKRNVNFNALIPIDGTEITEQGRRKAKPFKSLYLLHGYAGHHNDWLWGSRIKELSSKYNIAVFMPSGENNFYLDDVDKGELYGEFIGKELVDFTRNMFPISDRREDTFIGGLSMGGYGAIRNGLKYNSTFSRIIALSSALIIYNIAGIPEDFKDPVADYKYYRSVFGDLDQLVGSDKDPEALIAKLKEKNEKIPEIYMACGTEDFLLKENRRYQDFLVKQNINATYIESPGDHDWKFWDEYIEKAIVWAISKG
ncbi:MAG: acetylesterase [Clostridiales bacterium]|nr:acetylesterase [Clostridiales bacterium]